MTTALYLQNTAVNGIPGYLDLFGSTGAAAVQGVVNTTAGTGVQVQWTLTGGGASLAWITPPCAAAWTLAGAIAAKIWAMESITLANAQVRLRLYKYAAGVMTELPGSPFDRGVELTTTVALQSWSFTPSTSTSFTTGDQLVLVAYITNFGTMSAGRTCTMQWNGTSAQFADSSITLAETVQFEAIMAANVVMATTVTAVPQVPFSHVVPLFLLGGTDARSPTTLPSFRQLFGPYAQFINDSSLYVFRPMAITSPEGLQETLTDVKPDGSKPPYSLHQIGASGTWTSKGLTLSNSKQSGYSIPNFTDQMDHGVFLVFENPGTAAASFILGNGTNVQADGGWQLQVAANTLWEVQTRLQSGGNAISSFTPPASWTLGAINGIFVGYMGATTLIVYPFGAAAVSVITLPSARLPAARNIAVGSPYATISVAPQRQFFTVEPTLRPTTVKAALDARWANIAAELLTIRKLTLI